MANVLEKTEKETNKAINWVATQYRYMQNAMDILSGLKADPKNSKGKINQAIRDFNYAGRAEYIAGRSEAQLEKDLKELAKQVPQKIGEAILSAEHEMEIEEGELIKSGSRYMGALKNELNSISIQLALAEKGKGNTKVLWPMVDDAVSKFDQVIKWILALLIDLRKAKRIEQQIEAWIK